jgi:hypothetical protein
MNLVLITELYSELHGEIGWVNGIIDPLIEDLKR